jgi:hypothetical protein
MKFTTRIDRKLGHQFLVLIVSGLIVSTAFAQDWSLQGEAKKNPSLNEQTGVSYLAPGSTGGAPLRFLRSKRSEGSVAVVRDLVTARARHNKKPGLNEQTGFPNWRLAVTYSHTGTPALPSAMHRFTSEFDMGSGGSNALLPPGKLLTKGGRLMPAPSVATGNSVNSLIRVKQRALVLYDQATRAISTG